jgi:hypothetical protein
MPVKPTSSTTITAHKHTDRRANIPTEELRDVVADDEKAPKTLRYPRDPSLDPQLVWQGKDEQDSQDVAVPAVPIYLEKKIHPQSIIDDLLAQAAWPGSALRDEAATYQWLDALYLKVRQNHRLVSQAAMVAIGVRETGEREVLGLALGAARASRSGSSSCAVWSPEV